MDTNVIYCGDNLEVLSKYLPDESVDLIYIDPPFNSSRKYEVFWGEAVERRSFDDRFGDAMAYLDWMRPRLRELYRVLKPTGSFYYQCDWHASHYVKVELDRIFGFNNFQNEIVWYRSYAHNDPKRYGASHDVILFYSKSGKKTWNRLYTPYSAGHAANSFRYEDDIGSYQLVTLTASKPGGDTSYEWRGKKPPKGRYWAYSKANMERMEKEGRIAYSKTGTPRLKVYWKESKGVPLQSVWSDIRPIGAHAKERLGYPTQKPVELLERIVAASSKEGDVVLDAFCGCGTTLEAAAKLKRQWIGIDFSPTACRVMAQRLEDRLGMKEGEAFAVKDMPKDEAALRRMPHTEFENWSVIALGGIPNRVKVGDYGIDGRLYVADIVKERQSKRDLFGEIDNWYPIQVKQKDKAGRPDIDSFETAMRRDRRVRGYFVAFGFTKDAFVEIKRANKDDGLDIVPVTVKQLLEHERVAA